MLFINFPSKRCKTMAKTRRKNGEGCFIQRKGFYEYKITFLDKETGKKKLKYFSGKTPNECFIKSMKWKNKYYGVTANELNSQCSLAQWANYWFDNFVKGYVRESTVNDDRSILDKHIIPGLGDKLLCELNSFIIQEFYRSLENKDNGRGEKLSPKTIKNIASVLKRLIKQANSRELISKDYTSDLKLPKNTKKEMKVLTKAEQVLFIEDCLQCGTSKDFLLIFLVSTGTRLREALGLQWDKIDFDKKLIKINQQIQSVPNDDKNSEYKYKTKIIKETKTKHSTRVLPVFDITLSVLKKVKVGQSILKLKKGATYNKDLNLVFANTDGSFMCDTTIRTYFNKKLRRLGIEHIRLHDLRHTFATRMFEKDAPAKLVSSYLGHSNIGTTMDIYTHVTPDKKRDLIKIGSCFYDEILTKEEYKGYNIFAQKRNDKIIGFDPTKPR